MIITRCSDGDGSISSIPNIHARSVAPLFTSPLLPSLKILFLIVPLIYHLDPPSQPHSYPWKPFPLFHKPRHPPTRSRHHNRVYLLPHPLCNLVHVYERYATVVTVIVMLFLCVLGGTKEYHPNAQKPYEDVGRDLVVDVLSVRGIVFGSFLECVSEFERTRVSN